MSNIVTFTIDGVKVEGTVGQTIMEAADQAGIYIPRLCKMKDLLPRGSCRVCTVFVNGRPQSACTHPVMAGMSVVENNTEKLNKMRRHLVEMLFVEGNHYCMFCEKSGNCELQAVAYRLGIMAPTLPYLFPKRELDASHPDVLIDRNRCILCGRCVNASHQLDNKNVFQFVGRGSHKKIAVNAASDLAHSEAGKSDKALDACPVGAILRKRVGFKVPIGQRLYDHSPIGSEVENKAKATH